MSFGQWLNSLTWIDQAVILFLFGVAAVAANYTLQGLILLYGKVQHKNPFASQFRITPLGLFLVAIPYTILLYKMAGRLLSSWLTSLLY